jgi:lipoate---protein ligase
MTGLQMRRPDDSGGVGGGSSVSDAWTLAELTGTPAQLQGLDLWDADTVPGVDGRRLLWLHPTEPAVVLGSTQTLLVPSAGAVPSGGSPADGDVRVVVRRSGGGAVMIEPERVLWVEAVIPREDPLWVDDVGHGARWLGEAWVSALAANGVAARLYDGPVDRSALARAACFAGLAPGEVVTPDGRKLVGISQRRTRAGARLQCVLYTSEPSVLPLASVVGATVDGGAAAVAEALTGHSTIAAVDPGAVFADLCHTVTVSVGAGSRDGGRS